MTTALRFDDLPEAAVLTAPAAPVDAHWASEQLARHWGLGGQFEPLSGERDSNFRLRLGDGSTWLFKASHPIEPAEVTDFQTQALAHLARHAPELPVQRLRPTPCGRLSASAAAPDGRARVLRVISYLEGLPMPQAPRSAAQRASVAALLARLDSALAPLQHPAAQRQLPWDLQRAQAVDSLLDDVADPTRRALARAVLARHVRHTVPALARLPRQPIHNDFNFFNLLVDPQQPERVCGVLDFGDMLAAPRVCDLAVAAAYQVEPGEDALDTVLEFAAAYHAQAPLRDEELALLWPLVQARLAMIVAISGWRARRQPEHAAYLLRNNAVSWLRLQHCRQVTAEDAHHALRRACPR
jgi:hydroxylysine kinase